MRKAPLIIIALFALLLVITGCNLLNDDGRKSDNAELNYKVITPEARAVIEKIQQGIDPGYLVNGGATLELAKKFTAAQSGVENSTKAMPGSKPTSSKTRPKISLVMKKGGPAEYYILNKEESSNQTYHNGPHNIGVDDPYHIANMSVKTWTNRNNNCEDDYFYTTALVQSRPDVYASGGAHLARPNNPSLGGWSQELFGRELGIEPYELDKYIDTVCTPFDCTTFGTFYHYFAVPSAHFSDSYSSSKWHYNYIDVPEADFFNMETGPIPESWNWDPPYHFDTISWRIDKNNKAYYTAITTEGFENQTIYWNWLYSDFSNAYTGVTNSLYSQGWRIKDFDIENGIIAVILKKATYDEKTIFYNTETAVSTWIGDLWSQGYRGVCIDSSW